MEKLNFIFDTDAGSDCDDMMALTYLVYAARHKGLHLCAVTHSNGCPEGPDAIRVFFENLGEPVPPIGKAVTEMKAYDHYCKEIVARFDRSEGKHEYPDALTVLRRALVEHDNVVICAVGAMTNIAALLESEADEISPLDGISLVRKKCARIVLMAGIFDPAVTRTEWNIHLDIPAAKTVAERSPVPVIWLPSETGANVITGGPVIETFGESNPLSLSFCRFPGVLKKGGRPSWDPATAVYAVEGCREFLAESPACTVTVDDEGKSKMCHNGMGNHCILTLKEGANGAFAAYIDQCAMQIYHKA
ncbi:MAG: nucleoside hydrolase [Clostridia bacterium]|nr:nucleoside hydrolase [Clostridia bacterium]